MKKGLILEGGAMRGMFTAGVIDVMMENGIEFDGAIGVSAGAAFGCNYKSKQIGRVIRYNKRFVRDKRYCGLGVLLKTGDIYSAEFCYGEVPLKYDIFDFETFEKNPMEFYVVATDVETGEAVYHKYEGMADHGFDWIRASASMPIVSRIVEIDGRKLLDGGIADSIPVKYFESIGYNKNIAILTQCGGFQKKRNKAMPLIKLKYKKYPKLVETMANRHIVYNETLTYIEEKEKAGELFVIRPETKLPVGRVEKNPEKLQEAYEIGRKTALKHLERIKLFLGSEESPEF
ncbi:MAG: patatin family protein [Clostridia bacterium]|nr:patatin family protein [Clostridia bacterium]